MRITCVAFRGYTTTLQDYSIKQDDMVLQSRFLREACLLGTKALSMKGKGKGTAKEEANPETRREVDGEIEWNQLREQLYRRCELLAVCYSKNGDRKVISLPFC